MTAIDHDGKGFLLTAKCVGATCAQYQMGDENTKIFLRNVQKLLGVQVQEEAADAWYMEAIEIYAIISAGMEKMKAEEEKADAGEVTDENQIN